MKNLKALRALKVQLLVVMAFVLLALPLVVMAAAIIDDTFADGNSQNQDLANNSLRLFNGRASNNTRTDAVGSVRFGITSASSEAFWAFFTNPGSPVTLGVGDKVSVALTFSLSGFTANGSDIRFGVFDSLGTRNANNLTAGQNDATFVNDPGYGMQFFPSGSGAPFVIGRRANLTGANPFNSFADFSTIPGSGATARQTLANNTPYTLTYTIERTSATDTRITTAVTGGALSNLNYTAVESSSSPNTTFDYFSFRIAGSSFATGLTFTRMLIDYTPSPPVITSQPQPSNLTVQVGSNVTMSVAASGNSLSYQWRKDGVAITGNSSATTPTLQLTNVQLSDAGSYTCVVSNPGGSVTSNPVTLNVSTDPVPPPPSITTQPADTTVTVGGTATLSVQATGDNLFYQWFKNGALINGATGPTLTITNAQMSDTATYTVVVSNSSGSVTSAPARLLVVSTMQITGLAPPNGAADLCIDTPLYITFDQAPKVGTTGRLRVFQDDGTIVDTIDMGASSQSRLNGTVSFNYLPIIVTGNTAAIYLHQKLAYDRTYFVTIEPGVVTDATGAPFAGISDPNTWIFSTKSAGPAAGSTALTVAADNTGDFCTVQGAVDFVPANNTRRVVITVRKGTYTEIVYVGSNKPFITVRGEDREQSLIRYANNNNFNPTSTTTRAMFGVDAADFSLENITLHNTTPSGGSQAEAFRGNGLRIVLNRVNLKSFQDTLMLQSPGTSNMGGFVTDSYIEGDVDFVWGAGTVFFRNCELKMLRSNAFYTQIRNPQGKNGNVFVNCRLTAADGVTGSYLSRIDPNVFPFSQVVFINCAMGPHVRPDGWLLNNATTAPNVQFWEYHSTDLNGAPLDVSQRAPFSRQLTDAEAAQLSDPTFVLGGWVPPTKLTAALSLGNLTQTYTGSPIGVTVVTEPPGLNVEVTYNGSTQPPTAIGTYTVVATVQDATYQGTLTATLVIQAVPVTITLHNLNQIYDGTPKPVGVNTNPPGTPVTVTYNGSTTPPTEAGTYSVVATINDPNFRGGTSATLTISAPGTLQTRAFPGAEGAGAFARGGRGGDVYHVTNLDDSGAGSLRNGIQTATGPRTIVFDVSGTIFLNSRLLINKPFLTLAGQTAPGDGITVAGWHTVVSNTHDVVVRYMRFRVGDVNCPGYQDDSFTVDKSTDVMVDHVSASWSVDETLSVTESDRVTVQWSFITESMKNSCHVKGPHGYGSLIRYGNGVVTYHHNLYAHHLSRNPRVGDNIGFDFVNNVVYDWGSDAGYSADASEGTTRINYVGNYVIAGPSTPASKFRAFNGGSTNTVIYQSNNFIDSNKNGARDGSDTGWAMFTGSYTKREPARFDFPQIETEGAQTAYERVLAGAGASLKRDSVDTRIVSEVRSDGGSQIDSQSQVGGWPQLASLTAPPDTDGDGIPDQWESEHGLNPADAADGSIVTAGGFSNLELYLNDLVPVPNIDPSLDSTAPVTVATLSREPNAAGWHNSDVTVTLAARDNDGGAGLREITYTVNGTVMRTLGASASVTVTTEGVTTITFFAKDQAGNTEAVQTITVKLDKAAPVIADVTRTPPPNANGWNNTNVVATYTAADAVSGFGSGQTESGSFTFNAEGANQSFTFEVSDLAGNRASRTVEGVNIDKTAPAVVIAQPVEGGVYFLGQPTRAEYTCTDNLSGTSCAGTVGVGGQFDTATAGAKTFTVSATDLAGNTTIRRVGYTVGTSIQIDDAQFFVRQHYLDFLNREPDADGLAFWTNQITSCGSDARCIESRRINVSAAFYLSIEFQGTGYLAYRAYKAAFGNIPGKPVPITRQELVADSQLIGQGVVVGVGDWQERLEQNKRAYFDALVARQRFTALYPQSLTPEQFVDALNANAGGALSTAERNALVADLRGGTKTRAQVLRAVAEDADLNRAEFNPAFVLMEYIGYLRRNPDDAPDGNFAGFNFWLAKLNQFGGNFVQAEMVKAFIISSEYRRRFVTF